MNYPRYLRGFAKITLILSIIMFCFMITIHGSLMAGCCMLIAVPVMAISLWLIIAVAIELGKWIYKDFKKEQI